MRSRCRPSSGVDIEPPVVYAGLRRDDHAPAVERPFPTATCRRRSYSTASWSLSGNVSLAEKGSCLRNALMAAAGYARGPTLFFIQGESAFVASTPSPTEAR